VLQKNQQYSNLISLIQANKPDIVFTMETNSDWERALEGIESDYKYAYKIPLENRYGMHFYTNLNVVDLKEHYLIAKDRPAIEVHLKDSNGTDFIFWGIHPPPPSPTEKETSKQKDAELMVVAKLIQKSSYPCIITGDFNNVSWSKSAKLFAKISGCNDARIGKGVHATFPVKPKIFRFPIDLLFNSKAIKIHSIQTLSPIGSDHLPITTSFSIAPSQQKTEKLVKRETEEKAAKIITEGHQAVQEEE
jgi:endonuclease/exonuclease/phosphatase (EEP) superfamily protein YafD